MDSPACRLTLAICGARALKTASKSANATNAAVSRATVCSLMDLLATAQVRLNLHSSKILKFIAKNLDFVWFFGFSFFTGFC
jgi:hypothetical protein